MIFHPFNYGNGLFDLLKSISSKVSLPISVLFQHPSPSPSSEKDLSKAMSDCIKALQMTLITECVFGYDCHNSKSIGNWTNQRIISLYKSNMAEEIQDELVISDPNCISGFKEEKVIHPSVSLTG